MPANYGRLGNGETAHLLFLFSIHVRLPDKPLVYHGSGKEEGITTARKRNYTVYIPELTTDWSIIDSQKPRRGIGYRNKRCLFVGGKAQ